MAKYFGYFKTALITAFKTLFILLKISNKLPLRTRLSDFFSVATSIGFIGIPAFLVGFIFLLLPQGRDTILLVIEKMIAAQPFPLFGFLIGITLWSIFSELGVRYAISISDNSGINLSDERVKWRKTVQRLLAAFFLLWPFLVVTIGFGWVLFSASYISLGIRFLYVGLCFLILLVLFAILVSLYFYKFGSYGPNKPKKTLFGKRSLPAIEQKWLDKLYGIYNDYIFSLPKATSFKAPYNKDLSGFTDHFRKGTPLFLAGFPKDVSVMRPSRVLPESFKLQNPGGIISRKGDLYKWIYRVPSVFYKTFHKHVLIMSFISLGLVVIIGMIPSESVFFSYFGAPGLFCTAFACYTGIYSGLLYLDKAFLRDWKISIRFVLCCLFLAASYLNEDHPVRIYGEKQPRIDLTEHFRKWFAAYKDTIDAQYGPDPQRLYPVVFICAEGGAFRTGAYTGLFLSRMEEELSRRTRPVDFRNSIYAMSGVSGGAVGLGFYNAVAYRDQFPPDSNLVDKTRAFFLYDSLSPLVGKMLFGEFINLFIPFHIIRFDRAVALEKSWEVAYKKEVSGLSDNTYELPFSNGDTAAIKPVLIINSTEVETGFQCWVTNTDPKGLRFHNKRDLFSEKVINVRYSTAINFSSRFPLFSPGAEISDSLGNRMHYLDGGYVENTGSASMLELMEILQKTPEFKQIVPVLISLLFSEEDNMPSNIKAFNEITEITGVLYNTRVAKTKTSRDQLKEFVKNSNSGIPIDAPLRNSEKEVPMNWVLSEQSMNNIANNVDQALSRDSAVMKQFFNHGLKYLKLSKYK